MSCDKTIDMTGMDYCSQASTLYSAYIAMITGKQRVLVRYKDMWTQYSGHSAADIKALSELYLSVRAQCPNALAVGLPDIRPSARTQRGGPIHLYRRG